MLHKNDASKDIIYQMFLRVFTKDGNLKAARKLLPSIADLGVDIIYLCPVAEADDDTDQAHWSLRQIASGYGNPKNPYRIGDYYKIDPEYGIDDDLSDFVKDAHILGMRVILDLVYFHCGPASKIVREHPEYVKHDENGAILFGLWRFPILDFENRELREYLWSNMVYFVEKFDVDGYRCDVGDAVPLDFWAEGIRRAEKIKPDLYMLNEGQNPEYVKEVFQSNYFFAFSMEILPGVASGEKSVSYIRESYESHIREKLSGEGKALLAIENHDTASDFGENRIEKQLGFDGTQAALALTFTLRGAPMLYNGVEVCDTSKHSLWSNRFFANRAMIAWENALTKEAKERRRLIKELTFLYHTTEALWDSPVEWIDTSNEKILAYRRRASGKSVLIALNFSKDAQSEVLDGFCARILVSRFTVSRPMGEKIKIDFLPFGFTVIEE